MSWALWTVMMWRMEGDLANGGYSGFHMLWQIMGLVYPGVGLLCMFIPCFICDKKTEEDMNINFENEERENSRALNQKAADFQKTTGK